MARLIIFTGQSVKSIFTLDGINAKYQFPDSVENAQHMNAMIEQSGYNYTREHCGSIDMLPAVILYSYVFQNFNTDELMEQITLKKTDVERYFGLSQSKNGCRLFDRIVELSSIKCCFNGVLHKLIIIIKDRGKYIDLKLPLLRVIKEHYQIIKEMSEHEKIATAPAQNSHSGDLYYTKTVDAKLLKTRSPIAIAIVIELAKLVATTHIGGEPHISVKTLSDKIPMLYTFVNNKNQGIGAKNQQLRRIFRIVYSVIDKGEAIHIKNCALVDKPIPQLKSFDGGAVFKEKYVIRFEKKIQEEMEENVHN